MRNTFERAEQDRRGTRFVFRESTGLLREAGREWVAKLTTDASARERCLSASRTGSGGPSSLPGEVVEAQNRIAALIERMLYAIAHHDFAGAREYSHEEWEERARLRVLREKYGIAE
jgi:hypothetical protein